MVRFFGRARLQSAVNAAALMSIDRSRGHPCRPCRRILLSDEQKRTFVLFIIARCVLLLMRYRWRARLRAGTPSAAAVLRHRRIQWMEAPPDPAISFGVWNCLFVCSFGAERPQDLAPLCRSTCFTSLGAAPTATSEWIASAHFFS